MKPVDSTPELLRLRDAASPALTSALHDLSTRGPDASELASLATRLSLQGISMTLPHHAASPPAGAAHRLSWPLAATGTAAAVGLAAWLLWPSPPTSHAPVAPPAPAAASPVGQARSASKRAEIRSGAHLSGLPETPPVDAVPPSNPGAPVPPAPELEPRPASARSGTDESGTARAALGQAEPEADTVPRREPALSRKSGQLVQPSPNESETRPGAASVPSELELLRAARLALKSSPTEALRLAEEHRSDYPSGKLTQERELIAISALVALGRRTSALSRAAGFERAFPTSPYRKQIGELLQ
ncbi:MAG: hypothetical protein ABUL60_18890 [Myxococcales bacterium]